MIIPILSQMINLSQLELGRESMSIAHVMAPARGTHGTHGHRKGRGTLGALRRSTRMAIQTMVNARRVPMDTSSTSTDRGTNEARSETNAPVSRVDLCGVPYTGCTAPKNSGRSPSRVMDMRILKHGTKCKEKRAADTHQNRKKKKGASKNMVAKCAGGARAGFSSLTHLG